MYMQNTPIIFMKLRNTGHDPTITENAPLLTHRLLVQFELVYYQACFEIYRHFVGREDSNLDLRVDVRRFSVFFGLEDGLVVCLVDC